MNRLLARLATAIFGPRCPLGCGQRVHPCDLDRHLFIDHAGDERLNGAAS